MELEEKLKQAARDKIIEDRLLNFGKLDKVVSVFQYNGILHNLTVNKKTRKVKIRYRGGINSFISKELTFKL